MSSHVSSIGPAVLMALAAATAAAAPSLVVSPTAGAKTLDLDGDGTSGEHIVKVAGLTAETLHPLGLTVSVTSGSLVKTGGSPIPFRAATVMAGAAAPTATQFTAAPGTTSTFSTLTLGRTNRDVYILYTPARFQDPGVYSGTITITVMDNGL